MRGLVSSSASRASRSSHHRLVYAARALPSPLPARLARRGLSGSPAAPAAPASESFLSRVPWSLVLTVSFIGSVAGYFYRGSRATKAKNQLVERLRCESAISPGETLELHDTNKLSAGQYVELDRRARATWPTGVVDDGTTPLEFYQHFVTDQLGGEFQERRSLKARHLIERLAASLQEQGLGRDLRVLLLGLLLAVETSTSNYVDDALKALFETQADKLEQEERRMTRERLAEVVSGLSATHQFPVRVFVEETKAYPFNTYARISSDALLRRALEAFVLPRSKLAPSKAPEQLVDLEFDVPAMKLLRKFRRERDEQLRVRRELAAKDLSEREFIDLLRSNALCVWGECHAQWSGR